MVKKGWETSTSNERGVEMVLLASSLMLSKTNYCIWTMQMEVCLDSHNLWQAIVGDNVPKKKDHMVLLAILGAIPEEIMTIFDVKKIVKENWDILLLQHFEVDRVIQFQIQGLKCAYEILTMNKNEAVIEFAMKFTTIVLDLWKHDERLEKDVVC